DMLTTVIFFLLMSTTFIEYNKLTLPPASTVVSTSQSAADPLRPKLLVTRAGKELSLYLVWQGKTPGHQVIKVDPAEVSAKLTELLKTFAEKYPTEKTLQVSLDKEVNYQVLISVMDGSRELMPDVVLLSYHEVNQT
ncbi:MAG: biopolymer transporter ExbD, partial [Bdellovibrionales bacterium]|nr:biopolymer transporter ExbD [Oligoflexia bacterium]